MLMRSEYKRHANRLNNTLWCGCFSSVLQRPVDSWVDANVSEEHTAILSPKIGAGGHGNEISGSHGGDYEDGSSGLLRRVVWLKFTDVSEVLTASVIRAMTHRQKAAVFEAQKLKLPPAFVYA
jgi:hypothetical protein